MKEFVLAVIAIAVIGVTSALVLESFQRSADSAFVGSGTRIEIGAKPKG